MSDPVETIREWVIKGKKNEAVAATREAPQFVLMSALITLTMESMRRTIQALEAAGLRSVVKIGVGGAPLTHKFAAEIGADFYSEDAYGCVQRCNDYIAA